jgi:hypothetical protein
MKEQQIFHLKELDALILKYKGFPLLQEDIWVERTTLLHSLKKQYGAFPTWTPYGYTLEEKEASKHENIGGEVGI